jgi:hypothetical protein
MILDNIILEKLRRVRRTSAGDIDPSGRESQSSYSGGLNGGGKTTLLDCHSIGFSTEPRARISNRGPAILTRTICANRSTVGADPYEGASVVVRFSQDD